jgi:hypothetical protein
LMFPPAWLIVWQKAPQPSQSIPLIRVSTFLYSVLYIFSQLFPPPCLLSSLWSYILYCNVLWVLFKMDVYFHSKTQRTTFKYNQQLSKHVRTIHRRAIGPLACHNSTSVTIVHH